MTQATELQAAISAEDKLAQALRTAAHTVEMEASAIADQDSIEAAIAWAKFGGLKEAADRAVGNVRAMLRELADMEDPEGLRAEAL